VKEEKKIREEYRMLKRDYAPVGGFAKNYPNINKIIKEHLK
jgi:hypothetical protein